MTHKEAIEFFAELFGGRHHIPGRGYNADAKVKPWGKGWYVLVSAYLSTYDDDTLTRLVFLAHDKGYRAEVSPAMRFTRIVIHKRAVREGAMWERHPTLADAVAAWQGRSA